MNNKKEVAPLRTRKGSIYQKGTNETFKISRSKFSNFLDCKRCFYLERVKGLKDPSMPGWSLNSAVDELLKKEFDEYDGKPDIMSMGMGQTFKFDRDLMMKKTKQSSNASFTAAGGSVFSIFTC